MSDKIEINVTVNGKKVPLSSISAEIFNKIQDAELEKDVPVFSVANNVLIIKLTEEVKENLQDAMEGKCPYICLDKDGCWEWGFSKTAIMEDVKERFKTAKPLFGDN
jgi:hypothetical protein